MRSHGFSRHPRIFLLSALSAAACSSKSPPGARVDAASLAPLDPDATRAPPDGAVPDAPSAWSTVRLIDPSRTEVRAVDGTWLATFTDGARTVTLAGAVRSFDESGAAAPVVTSVWVRLLAEPFDPARGLEVDWLRAHLGDPSDDLLAIAMQYVEGAPDIVVDGLRIAGDAHYGPLIDGARQEGSDFNDYLGVDWSYPDGSIDAAEPHQIGSLDCSGYVRMLFGFRGVVPFVRGSDGASVALPRRAVQMLASAPGVVTMPDTGAPPPHERLAAGDLVFFDADPDDGPDVDHVGIFLGVDEDGRPRFLSSRKTVDGPTLGDVGGSSVLDGGGLYARSFRAARRL